MDIFVYFLKENLFSVFNLTKQGFTLSTFTLWKGHTMCDSMFAVYFIHIKTLFYKYLIVIRGIFIKWKVRNIKLSYSACVNGKNERLNAQCWIAFQQCVPVSKLNRLKGEINTKRVTIRGGGGGKCSPGVVVGVDSG